MDIISMQTTVDPMNTTTTTGGAALDSSVDGLVEDDALIALIFDELKDFNVDDPKKPSNHLLIPSCGGVATHSSTTGSIQACSHPSIPTCKQPSAAHGSTDESSSDESPTPSTKQANRKTSTRKRPRSEQYLLMKEVEELQQMVEAVRRKRVVTNARPPGSPALSDSSSVGSSPSRQPRPPRTKPLDKDHDMVATRDRDTLEVVITSDSARRANIRRQVAEANRKLTEIIKMQVDATALQLSQMAQMQPPDPTGLEQPGDELDSTPADFGLDWAASLNPLNLSPLSAPQAPPPSPCETPPAGAPPSFVPSSVPCLSTHDEQVLEADQARLSLLLQKIENSYKLVDQVFYKGSSSSTQPPKSTRSPSQIPMSSPLSFLDQIPDMPLISSHAIASEPVHQAQLPAGVVNLHANCAELVDNRVVPYDADVLIGLLYKCFNLQAKKCCNETYANQMTNAYLNCVLDKVIHTKFCISLMLRQINVNVDAHTAMRLRDNVFVLESMGIITPERLQPHVEDCSVAQMEYTRTSWCRVDSLGNGFSVVRHVTRITPVSDIDPILNADPQRYREEQLHILLGLLQRGQQDTLKFFAQVIGSQSDDNLLGVMSVAASME